MTRRLAVEWLWLVGCALGGGLISLALYALNIGGTWGWVEATGVGMYACLAAYLVTGAVRLTVASLRSVVVTSPRRPASRA